MGNAHSQLKSFIDSHPEIDTIRIVYSETSYFLVKIRYYLNEDSKRMMEISRAIRYEDLDHFDFMDILGLIYKEGQYLE